MACNYDTLSEPVTKQEVIDYKQKISKVRNIYSTFNQLGTIFGFVISFILAFMLITVGSFEFKKGNYTLLVAGIGVICLTIIAGLVTYFVSYLNKLKDDIKLSRFSQANGLSYEPAVDAVDLKYPGMIFNVGYSHLYRGRLRDETGDLFEISNYQYTIGSGKNRRTIENGYVMIKLDRNLPNIVLDSNQNNFKLLGLNMSNLPVNFKNNQKLSLEGDFNNYFTLYAPVGYERDALYIFTPDLMALFVDNSSIFDAEVIDDKLFIYSSKFDLVDSSVLDRLFKIIDTVGKKTLSQTDNYSDERVGNRTVDEVSVRGMRLKKQFVSVGVVLSIVIFILMVIVF